MGKRIPPSERLEQELFSGMVTGGDPLGEAARRGSQLVLQKALEMEGSEFLGRGHYERGGDGGVMGYRNGYERKKVHRREGTIELEVPQLRETVEAFESVWLRAIGRRSKRLVELMPMRYVKGMSQRDIEEALIEGVGVVVGLGVVGTGRSVVGEVCRELRAEFGRWQERELGGQEVVYLFLDGTYLKLRPEDKRGVAVLCAYGVLWSGEKVLLHLEVGDKESAACWEAFLEDMKGRGLRDPLLVVIDGNSGLRKAVREKLPQTLVQRCQVHKLRNVLTKLPEVTRGGIKKRIRKAFTARSYKEGLSQARKIVADYRESFPSAMRCLEQDLEECLTALKFPCVHRRQIRTTNLLERLFGEGRRRTKVIPRFTSEASGMALVFAVLVDASEGWHGVRMKPHIEARLKQMCVDPDSDWEDPDLKKLAA